MTGPVTLTSWEPRARHPTTQSIASAEQVALRAAELLRRYKETDFGFPGLSLEPGAKDCGSLFIAVAPIGWALIHNSEDFLTQHCTRARNPDGGPSITVLFGEPNWIPRNCFIPGELALEGVRYFIERGALAPNLQWTDRCQE